MRAWRRFFHCGFRSIYQTKKGRGNSGGRATEIIGRFVCFFRGLALDKGVRLLEFHLSKSVIPESLRQVGFEQAHHKTRLQEILQIHGDVQIGIYSDERVRSGSCQGIWKFKCLSSGKSPVKDVGLSKRPEILKQK